MSMPVKIGFVPANRRYFSTELALKMRDQTLDAFGRLGVEVVVPDKNVTEAGCVKNRDEGRKCGELFRSAGVDGIVVGAMNFGDEQACVTAVEGTGKAVPVMIFGCHEEEVLRPNLPRRDAFCGLLSIAEALRQAGIKYTIAQTPICYPSEDGFLTELDHFVRICRVIKGMRGARIGQIGPRPEAFWTCRYDEKMLQQIGVTVVPKDLSELLGAANRLNDDEPGVQAKMQDIQAKIDTSLISPEILLKIAKFERALEDMIVQFDMNAVAIQCWNSLQLNYGIVACGVLARIGDAGIPVACEADVLGALSMYALTLASGSSAALLDWNNLHNSDPELVNLWHCGVFPPSFAEEKPKMNVQGIMSKHIGPEISTGVLELRVKPGPVTLCRVAQGLPGEGWKAFIAQGFFEEPAATFGAGAWCRIPRLQHIYRDILLDHFTHHIAVTRGRVGNVLHEVFGNYLGMAVYHGGQAIPGAYTRQAPFEFVITD